MTELDHTHDRAARSCIATTNAAGFDFPIQDLPFAGFHRAGGPEDFRGGVAIGEQIVDLDALSRSASLGSQAQEAAGACRQAELNRFFAMGRLAWKALRHALFGLLHCDANAFSRQVLKTCLVPQSLAEHTVPARIGNYTDYISIYYATNIGRLFRPNDPLPTNLRWIPIASRGRASSVGVPGQQVTRPWNQVLPAREAAPRYGRCARLDYELELGIFIGSANARGKRVTVGKIEDHVFGLSLLNDWSARDIQAWESTPLGRFLAKNFATMISPWTVMLETVAPYREPRRPTPAGTFSGGFSFCGSGKLRLALSIVPDVRRPLARALLPRPYSDVVVREAKFHPHWLWRSLRPIRRSGMPPAYMCKRYEPEWPRPLAKGLSLA